MAKILLGPLGLRIRRHLQEYRPKMAMELIETGTLDQTAFELQERVLQTQAELMQAGMLPHEAREATLEMWALPDEEDVPEL